MTLSNFQKKTEFIKEIKNDYEIFGMYTYFVLSWKHDLTKGDYNLKAVQDICYSI